MKIFKWQSFLESTFINYYEDYFLWVYLAKKMFIKRRQPFQELLKKKSKTKSYFLPEEKKYYANVLRRALPQIGKMRFGSCFGEVAFPLSSYQPLHSKLILNFLWKALFSKTGLEVKRYFVVKILDPF